MKKIERTQEYINDLYIKPIYELMSLYGLKKSTIQKDRRLYGGVCVCIKRERHLYEIPVIEY